MVRRRCRVQQQPNGFGYWIGGDGIDQADLQGFGGVEFFGGQEHLQCAAFADEARKPLRTAPPGN